MDRGVDEVRALPRRLLIAFAAAAALTTASGCGGSSRSPADASPPAAPVTATPAETATTPSGVEISGPTYRFTAKGYAVDVPQGWTALPDDFNDVAGGQFPTDVMFPTGATGDASPAISIECLKASAGQATADAFRDAHAAFLAQVGESVAAPRPVRIGDQAGYAIDYVQNVAQANGTLVFEKTDAVAVVGSCRWLISLSAPSGQRSTHATEFDAMLRSMTFFPPAG